MFTEWNNIWIWIKRKKMLDSCGKKNEFSQRKMSYIVYYIIEMLDENFVTIVLCYWLKYTVVRSLSVVCDSDLSKLFKCQYDDGIFQVVTFKFETQSTLQHSQTVVMMGVNVVIKTSTDRFTIIVQIYSKWTDSKLIESKSVNV